MIARIHLPLVRHSALYAIALGASIVLAGLVIFSLSSGGCSRLMRYIAWSAFVLASVIACWFGFSYSTLLSALVLFFSGFVISKASSHHTSKLADPGLRGSVMGFSRVVSFSEFLVVVCSYMFLRRYLAQWLYRFYVSYWSVVGGCFITRSTMT